MKHLFPYELFERSSLTKLGVPKKVMQYIQKAYKLDPDAEWERIIKSEIKGILEGYDRALIVEMNLDYIKVITTFNDKYMYETAIYEEDEWGGKFVWGKREFSNITRTIFDISRDSLFWLLKGGDFETLGEKSIKIKKGTEELEAVTLEFKIKVIDGFNRVFKKLYGEKYKDAMIRMLGNMKTALKKGAAAELEKLINDNAELKRLADKYRALKDADDVLGLKRLEMRYNSLSVLDEYLIGFETAISEEFEVHWNILNVIDMFGWDKAMTSFSYFLLTGKLMKLK